MIRVEAVEAGVAPGSAVTELIAVARAEAPAALAALLGVAPESLGAVDPGFVAGNRDTTRVLLSGPTGVRQVVAVALPETASTAITSAGPREALTEAGMALAQAAPDGGHLSWAAELGPEQLGAVVEGLLIGAHRVDPVAALAAEATYFVPVADDEARRAVADAVDAADAVAWVRRLVEEPPNRLGPVEFAEAIAERAEGSGLEVRVWSEAELAAEGFGGLLGVAAGSERPAVAVELIGAADGPVLGLVGKGITFDAGGMNVKQDGQEISWMKADMAAAAAVAAAVISAARQRPGLRARAFLPLAENLPSGGAQKPGDVIVHPDGTRTEVTDTDSEGRLVIADGLAWLRRQGVAALVDAGTLTDGGGVGGALWGAWGTDRPLAEAMLAAGVAAGEPGWLLPLHDRYRQALDSPIADLRNMPLDRPDIGQVAAEYLRHFAGETPWLHLDIGSSAYLEVEIGPWPVGATGSPVRALRRFLIDHEG